MSKRYNVLKQSDMSRFSKDLENAIYSTIKDGINNSTYEIECPDCHKSFKAAVAKNICPNCGATVNLDVKF